MSEEPSKPRNNYDEKTKRIRLDKTLYHKLQLLCNKMGEWSLQYLIEYLYQQYFTTIPISDGRQEQEKNVCCELLVDLIESGYVDIGLIQQLAMNKGTNFYNEFNSCIAKQIESQGGYVQQNNASNTSMNSDLTTRYFGAWP